ncbi:hypothetical protein LKI01_10230 [Companilactobacillus paralimentarius]|uniref:Integral membrane protein n=1 Tax=Companilactobacillus kimchii TaxID=2801452 RepID=A0A210P999_9LACO|nr:hypothetical protein ATN91_14650 [Companilactobacillus kimchii]OWF33064.1 hypothetical protein LKACC12383_01554 [Companilactobacillus kimchii]GEO47024.1 hypothetical protein LKI01_10230 [Companilactobacillus paralimentarius]
MRKYTSILTTVLWALIIAYAIKNVAINHGVYNFDISLNFKDPFGWLLSVTLLVTAFDYICYHLIYPKKK